MKIFLATLTSTLFFLIGLMFIIWATSMAFQLLSQWMSIILFIIITLGSIVGLVKLSLLNIPFLWFKTRIMFPSLFAGILALAFSLFSLWKYKELNTFYFPSWVYIALFSALIISTLSSLLNLPKVISLMKKSDYETIRDKVLSERIDN